MKFPHGITATVERPGGTDQYGNPLPGTTYTVDGCAPAPAGSTEKHGPEATVEWDLDLLIPYGAPLTPTPPSEEPAGIAAQDVVTLPGDTTRYQVHGMPKHFRSPFTGWEAGTVVRLKGVAG